MIPILQFIEFIIQGVLFLIFWLIIVNAVISWLVAFNVINLRNRTAWNIVRALDRATDPLLRPLRRFIPPLGGIDITPVILLLVIQGIRLFLVPGLFGWLRGLFAPTIL